MRTGTIQVQHRNRVHPRDQKSSTPTRNIIPSQTARNDAPLRLTSAEIRATAKDLRELVLWDLREEGYTFRELGELFGMTKQRASQIERKMILRATSRTLKQPTEMGRPAMKSILKMPGVWIRAITHEEFEDRLASINRFYQEQFDRIIERGYKRQRLSKHVGGAQAASEFWRVWPFIEVYQRRPFSFSKLIADFPQLSYEPHLAQLLSRLRRTGLLQKVGMISVSGHNHPEVVMAEAPVEQHVTAAIDRLVARWSDHLRRLQMTRRPYRPNRSIELTRRWLIERLIGEGVPQDQIDEVFPPKADGSHEVEHTNL